MVVSAKRERTPTQAFDPDVDGANDSSRLGKVRVVKKIKKTGKVVKSKKKEVSEDKDDAMDADGPLEFTYFAVMAKGLMPTLCLEVPSLTHAPFSACQ